MVPISPADMMPYMPWFKLSLLAIFIGGMSRRKTDKDSDRRSDLVMIAILWLAPHLADYVLVAVDKLSQATFDVQLYAIDTSLGLHPIEFAQRIVSHPWLFRFFIELYHSYPLAVGIIWAAERNRTLRRGWIIGLALCPIFYWLVPAVGPMAVFVDWPWTSTVGLINPVAFRNCFPSMHISWPLMALLNVRNRVLWRGVLVYFVLTCIATIALGQHYFIDLIAAVPFCLAVQWAAKSVFARARARIFQPAALATKPVPAQD